MLSWDSFTYFVSGNHRHILLFHEEAVNGLLLAHELNDPAVEVDKKSPTKATGNPKGGEEGVSVVRTAPAVLEAGIFGEGTVHQTPMKLTL